MDTNEIRYSQFNRYGDSDVTWQNKCLNKISNKQNVILSSPTGSGKTKVFLEWAKQQEGKPVIITAPIKALSNQRYRELLQAGYTVGLETGDIKNVPENCDFICCTQEIYTNKYAELEDITLIMDEFHYIFENAERARTYIDALHNSKAKNILLCSATLGDVNKLREYVDKVSGRDFFAYENKSRLTSLFFQGDIDSEAISDSLIVTFSRRNIKYILNQLGRLREEQDDEQIRRISELASKDKINNDEIVYNAKKGIAGYYGALLPKEKLFIEKCFEQGLIDTIVGTDALALGVNFPVENVIFAQLAKYYDGPISKNLFEQLAGRAGRKGYFDEGYVYYCSDFANQLETWKYDTGELFGKILEQPNEDISINLTTNIKSILLEKVSIEEEAEFIARFSTDEVDVNYTFENISKCIDYIRNHAFENEIERIVTEEFGEYEEYWDDDLEEYVQEESSEEKMQYRNELLKKKEEFNQNIAKVYFDEYSSEKNCRIFADILSGINPDEILERYASGSFYDMLQFRKYVKLLPKQYRKGLTKINDAIREIDETAIDGFRGSIEVNEIGKQLKKEKRLNGQNVMQTLNDQVSAQRMYERADILEEQLRIAEEYGVEGY